jgi:hypothetical protein
MTSGFLGFNGKKGRRVKRPRAIIASATDLAMLGLFFIYTSSKGGHGETAQFVPSSFMDTLYSDAIPVCV